MSNYFAHNFKIYIIERNQHYHFIKLMEIIIEVFDC